MRAFGGEPRPLVSICAALLAAAVAIGCDGEASSTPSTVGAGTGGTDSGVPDTCPELAPAPGTSCTSEGLTCPAVPENPCDVTPTVCVDGTWQQRSPEGCDGCPSALPPGGSACGPVGLSCNYPGQPMDHATCNAYTDQALCAPDGAWTLSTATVDVCDPCPEALPTHGSSCFVGERSCPYTLDTPCGPREAAARCDLAARTWNVELPPCLCGAIVDESVCGIAAGCQWIDLGPCAKSGFVASCHPVICSNDLCEPASLCDTPCDATSPDCDCGKVTNVCLSP